MARTYPDPIDGQEAARRLGLLVNVTTANTRRVKACQVRKNLGDAGHLKMQRRGRTAIYLSESVDELLARIERGEIAMDMQGRVTVIGQNC